MLAYDEKKQTRKTAKKRKTNRPDVDLDIQENSPERYLDNDDDLRVFLSPRSKDSDTLSCSEGMDHSNACEDDSALADTRVKDAKSRKSMNKEVTTAFFHKKTFLCDSITPEAVVETLKWNEGILLIKTDEMEGWVEKHMGPNSNITSTLCSAFSGESIDYTTIGRGKKIIILSTIGMFYSQALLR